MKNDFINYIKEKEVVEINVLIKELNLDMKYISFNIDKFNKYSCYYKITKVENILYWETKDLFSSKKSERILVLKNLYLMSVYSIEELELIFGRNRKTLYKDIKKIKETILMEFNTSNNNELFYQNILNEIDYLIINKTIELKKINEITIFDNITTSLDTLLKLNISKEVIEKRKYTADEVNARNLTNDIVNNIQKYKKKKLNNKFDYKKLILHCSNSYYRYKNMVFEKRIDVKKIIKPYSNEYYEVSTIIKMVFKSNRLYYNEEEILYIALFFLDSDIYDNIKIKICSLKKSRDLFIKRELSKNFKDYSIVNENEDLIISDYNCESNNKIVLKINTPFQIDDIKKISEYLKFNKQDSRDLYFKLKPLLKPGIDYDKFSNTVFKVNQKYKLEEIILEENFIFLDEQINWMDSINKTAKILENKGYITNRYKENIINLINKYSYEFTIVEGVALVHAPISNEVFNSSFSFLFNLQEIIFPKNHKIKLIILFCATNEIDLLLPLIEINELLLSKDFSEKIKEVKSETEIKKLLMSQK